MKNHAAAHHSITVISRGKGRSATGAAAYIGAMKIADDRDGRVHDYRRKRGVERVEIVGFPGDAAQLWNAAEAAETRRNSCVARETILAIPAELSEDRRQALVRGYALWLRDTYGVAAMTAIHAPSREGDARNCHGHVLETTRAVERKSGAFGGKIRLMDDRKSGPIEVERRRVEWARRANAELARIGAAARIDHRSHARRAATGDEPAGMIRVRHQGPARTAVTRKARTNGDPAPPWEDERQAALRINGQLRDTWMFLRAELRARAREEADAKAMTTPAEPVAPTPVHPAFPRPPSPHDDPMLAAVADVMAAAQGVRDDAWLDADDPPPSAVAAGQGPPGVPPDDDDEKRLAARRARRRSRQR
ncbi:MobA/MobL family protein [Rubrimonas cliftonensis]|nr:MobA/MobL family protein [Rubrimonas cliftonensis]